MIKIPIAKPYLGEREAEAVQRVLASGWITQGPEVEAFETEFASTVGAKYACAVSNCTSALFLSLTAVGVGAGDEVITVSHSFIASANSIVHCGATPVFVDIDPKTFNVDPALIERVITPKTKAILCVHQLGMPCDISTIIPIAKHHGIPVVEDAACAIGSEILYNDKWEKIGKPHADTACFSFHPRKILTTGDGGMITTNNDEFDKKFRLLRQHGMSVPDTVRHSSRQVVFESYNIVGYNFRMTDLQASIGREQLKRLPDIVERRRHLAKRYNNLLADLPSIEPPYEPEYAKSNWQSYCVRLADGIDQRNIMQKLLEAGIATRRGVMNVHMEPAYLDEKWLCGVDRSTCRCPEGTCARLSNSEECNKRCILLPIYHAMSEKDQDKVAGAIEKASRG